MQVAGQGPGSFLESAEEDTAECSRLQCSFFPSVSLLRGTHTPSFAHSAPMRAVEFF
jgi:hypothetical protein